MKVALEHTVKTPSCCGFYMKKQSIKQAPAWTSKHTSYICLICGSMVLYNPGFEKVKLTEPPARTKYKTKK